MPLSSALRSHPFLSPAPTSLRRRGVGMLSLAAFQPRRRVLSLVAAAPQPRRRVLTLAAAAPPPDGSDDDEQDLSLTEPGPSDSDPDSGVAVHMSGSPPTFSTTLVSYLLHPTTQFTLALVGFLVSVLPSVPLPFPLLALVTRFPQLQTLLPHFRTVATHVPDADQLLQRTATIYGWDKLVPPRTTATATDTADTSAATPSAATSATVGPDGSTTFTVRIPPASTDSFVHLVVPAGSVVEVSE